MPVSSTLSKGQIAALLEGLQRLCAIFWGPKLDDCKQMLQGHYFQPFKASDTALGDETAAVLGEIERFLNTHAKDVALFEHLETEYVRLFISNRDGIRAPLYESCYDAKDALLMGEPAVMMKKRFESKQLTLADTMNEPPDHLSIELEYLYFLLQKGWLENHRRFIVEAAEFAGDLMLPWVGNFHDKLTIATRFPFYPMMTALLICFLRFVAKQT